MKKLLMLFISIIVCGSKLEKDLKGLAQYSEEVMPGMGSKLFGDIIALVAARSSQMPYNPGTSTRVATKDANLREDHNHAEDPSPLARTETKRK